MSDGPAGIIATVRFLWNSGLMRVVLAGLALCAATAAGTELVDRIVAAVGRSAILESDLVLARIVHLVPVEGLSPEEARRAIFEGRLRLEIQYRDLEASGVVYRLKVDREAVERDLERRAGGGEKLRAALEGAGLGMEDLRELALEVGAVNAYVDQRLRPRVRVSFQELRTAYQETLVLEITARGEKPPPLEEVRDQLHSLLVERKLNGEIEKWIGEARSRLDVTILVPPEKLLPAAGSG